MGSIIRAQRAISEGAGRRAGSVSADAWNGDGDTGGAGGGGIDGAIAGLTILRADVPTGEGIVGIQRIIAGDVDSLAVLGKLSGVRGMHLDRRIDGLTVHVAGDGRPRRGEGEQRRCDVADWRRVEIEELPARIVHDDQRVIRGHGQHGSRDAGSLSGESGAGGGRDGRNHQLRSAAHEEVVAIFVHHHGVRLIRQSDRRAYIAALEVKRHQVQRLRAGHVEQRLAGAGSMDIDRVAADGQTGAKVANFVLRRGIADRGQTLGDNRRVAGIRGRDRTAIADRNVDGIVGGVLQLQSADGVAVGVEDGGGQRLNVVGVDGDIFLSGGTDAKLNALGGTGKEISSGTGGLGDGGVDDGRAGLVGSGDAILVDGNNVRILRD